MQKAMYPCKAIRITQHDHEGTHKYSWAVDEAGNDGGISNFIAPFTGVVKKIYTRDANEVWLESVDKVEFADGTIDYMTIMLAHDNNVSNLRVGQIIEQGQVFYQEGTKGRASGNHVHFEVAKGKFVATGWHSDPDGNWNIYNGKKVTECLFIDDTYKVINTKGYTFKKVQVYFGNPIARDESKRQVEVLIDNLRARKTVGGEILGYIKKGIYNILEEKLDKYVWVKVENDLWIATDGSWSKIYVPKPIEPPKPVEPPKPIEPPKPVEPPIDNDKETIEKLKAQLEEKDKKLLELKQELESHIKIKNIFETKKYKIKLYAGETLYIKKGIE